MISVGYLSRIPNSSGPRDPWRSHHCHDGWRHCLQSFQPKPGRDLQRGKYLLNSSFFLLSLWHEGRLKMPLPNWVLFSPKVRMFILMRMCREITQETTSGRILFSRDEFSSKHLFFKKSLISKIAPPKHLQAWRYFTPAWRFSGERKLELAPGRLYVVDLMTMFLSTTLAMETLDFFVLIKWKIIVIAPPLII